MYSNQSIAMLWQRTGCVKWGPWMSIRCREMISQAWAVQVNADIDATET
jgi:hypothetical protein